MTAAPVHLAGERLTLDPAGHVAWLRGKRTGSAAPGKSPAQLQVLTQVQEQ